MICTVGIPVATSNRLLTGSTRTDRSDVMSVKSDDMSVDSDEVSRTRLFSDEMSGIHQTRLKASLIHIKCKDSAARKRYGYR